jgi:hypothetical protein
MGPAPKCHFVTGVLKFAKLGFLRFWKPITLCVYFWLRWGLKQSCSPHWDLSNGMCHITWMQVNQGNSWLLMVGNQIANLTSNLSFGHNLCFKYSNESCKPILDIYVSRVLQWYNELFNPMSFDPYNRFLKIQESIEILIPKVGAHLGVWGFIPSHSPTLPRAWNVTSKLQSWPAPLQALTLVASPRLRLQHLSSSCFSLMLLLFLRNVIFIPPWHRVYSSSTLFLFFFNVACPFPRRCSFSLMLFLLFFYAVPAPLWCYSCSSWCGCYYLTPLLLSFFFLSCCFSFQQCWCSSYFKMVRPPFMFL